jgi:HAD superfamily hydrolase (TIGR01509 family)
MIQRMNAVFFDMDGTLVDSERLCQIVARAVLKRYARGRPRDALIEEAVALIPGHKLAVSARFAMENELVTLSEPELMDTISREYQRRVKSEAPAVPGSAEAVRSLKKEFQLGLVSGSSRAEIKTVLTALGIYELFDLILGAEDYALSKPSPEGYALAMKKLGVGRGEAVCFEDSRAGIQSAKAAGLWVVAVKAANHFHFDQSAADETIDDFRGITPEWIRARFRHGA